MRSIRYTDAPCVPRASSVADAEAFHTSQLAKALLISWRCHVYTLHRQFSRDVSVIFRRLSSSSGLLHACPMDDVFARLGSAPHPLSLPDA
eukprot:3136918-Pleurochrysis_carterae.AAC.2